MGLVGATRVSPRVWQGSAGCHHSLASASRVSPRAWRGPAGCHHSLAAVTGTMRAVPWIGARCHRCRATTCSASTAVPSSGSHQDPEQGRASPSRAVLGCLGLSCPHPLSRGAEPAPTPEGSTPGWHRRIPRDAPCQGRAGMSWLSPNPGGDAGTSLCPIPTLLGHPGNIFQCCDAGSGILGWGKGSSVPSVPRLGDAQGISVPAEMRVRGAGAARSPRGAGLCGGCAALPSPSRGRGSPRCRTRRGRGAPPGGCGAGGRWGRCGPPLPARCQPGVTCRSVAPEHAQLRLRLRLPLRLGLGLGVPGMMLRP